MILLRLDISWGFTETLVCARFLNIPFCMHSSAVCLLIKNSPKHWSTYIIINNGKGAMYFSISSFVVWDFFAWKLVIMQEWKMCINIVEWKSVHWKKISDAYYQVLFSYINSTDNIWNMSDGKVVMMIQYQIIILNIQKFSVLSYQSCELKGINISILILILLVGCYV